LSEAAEIGCLMLEHKIQCVLLADRHHGMSEAVRSMLATLFETVVMVADEPSLLDTVRRLQPDVAVVDLSLAGGSSLLWLRELHARCPDVGVVVISVHDEESVRCEVMAEGASAFVVKRAISTELLPAIDRLRAGRSVGASTCKGEAEN